MSELSFIVLARAVHVMAGVTWAGAVFVMAAVVAPLSARHGAEGAGRWLGLVAGRAGRISIITALLTVLSGVYLFAVLHRHDTSASGLVLISGAVAALLALALGLLVARPTGLRLARLGQAQAGGAAPTAEMLRQMEQLRLRATVSGRVAAGLLGASVLAMAVFRYAVALA